MNVSVAPGMETGEDIRNVRHIDELCDRFEAEWRSGTPPRIAEYLSAVSATAGRRQTRSLLLELVMIDLEYRWRRASSGPGETSDTTTADQSKAPTVPNRPLLEHYAGRYADLGPLDELPQEVIACEYRARRLWGDQPTHDEYQRRFPTRSKELASVLARVDDEPRRDLPDVARGGSSSDDAPPKTRRFERYRVIEKLGEGGFGSVYEGYDEKLSRHVAIKVPHRARVRTSDDVEVYIREARVVAQLDHPAIVPVYDVGPTDDGLCFAVSKFVEGTSLDERIRERRPGHREASELIATVAEALHYAHRRGVVHRDIKPANILLDTEGKPYLADFGVALKEEDVGSESALVGTPPYMSPEEARGEGHLVDGRSDIFSLGIVFYELLCGRRPFQSDSLPDLLNRISTVDARPLRQVDDQIPKELERICLKALANRASDRYTTALDLADDLRHFLTTENDDGGPHYAAEPTAPAGEDEAVKPFRIVPKGLHSFDAADSDFFLELLPGPRDREGLPESVHFWKDRIEHSDADETFRVGLIYGPSGCGKSSFVKAGLLPRLSDHVTVVYVEATADATAARLLAGLRKCCPGLSEKLDLKQSLAEVRRRREGQKVLIVFDQFEQWLHAKRGVENPELAQALRQCDGGRLQCLLLVRDDFWMAVTHFMQSLEIRLVEGHNSATVDLFSPRHAQRVFTAFGRAFGNLPHAGELTSQQEQFVERAINALTREGKVICVRLAVFAEMVKGKQWIPATLKQVGGSDGVGATFLEEAFSAETAPPAHRYHQEASRAVLKALLPESGTAIRGYMRSQQELLEASGYVRREKEFRDLVDILDSELRLITPTDPEGAESEFEKEAERAEGKYYQLTHDYLVPPLQKWLTRKQQETRRGRAELRLAEQAALWDAKPENRNLSSCWEVLAIASLTPKENWTEPQRRMMRHAGWYYALRTAGLAALLGLLAWAGLESYSAILSAELVRSLATAETSDVPTIVDEISGFRRWADPRLAAMLQDADDNSKDRLHASLALLPVDPLQVGYLKDRLLAASPQQLPVLRDALRPQKHQLQEDLWGVLQDTSEQRSEQTLQSASALAHYDSDSDRWDRVAERVADALVSVYPFDLGHWMQALRPVRSQLVGPLSSIYQDRDGTYSDSQRTLAINILADYAEDRPAVLVDLVLSGEPDQFNVLFPQLEHHGSASVALLESALDRELSPEWNDLPIDAAWTTPDEAFVDEIEAAYGLVTERSAFCQTITLERFVRLAESLRTAGYRPVRFRPYAVGDSVQVAAVWTRDGCGWRIDYGLDADEVRQQDELMRMEGSRPVDVAGYLTNSDEGRVERYAAVWREQLNDEEDAWVFVATSREDDTIIYQELEEDGVVCQETLQAFCGLDGQPTYCGVNSTQGEEDSWSWNMDSAQYAGTEHLDKTLWDIDVSRAAEPDSGRERYARQLADAEEKLTAEPGDLGARFSRAQANFCLGNDRESKEDLDFLMAKSLAFAAAYELRAIIHARGGYAEEAKQDLASFKELSNCESSQAYLDAIVSAYLDEDDEGVNRLEESVAAHSSDQSFLYDAARALALASGADEERAPAESERYANRAVALLEQTVELGYDDFARMQTESDLERVREHPKFQAIIGGGELGRRYAAVWKGSDEYEGTGLHGLPPQEQLDRCRQLVKDGYRPVAISVASISDGQPLVTASVWHRPLIRGEKREDRVRRQANAAIGLLRMGAAERLWPLLQHQSDPRLRSRLIHTFSPLGVDASTLADRLDHETDASMRRALVLSIGDYDDLPEEFRELLTGTLRDLYWDDPDPGIHGACELLLRRWGRIDKIEEVDSDLATGQVEGQRQWYINRLGQTMVVLEGPLEFLMGSLSADEDREPLHRKRIARSFAIATKEVTVDEFQRFLRENPTVHHSCDERYALEPNSPQFSVTWYVAAAYCRWLSEQEEIPDDQMCYPAIDQIKEGMQLPADYLSRSGYRLPTEAEWEYACRAGSTTSRYYGQDEELLGEYAWCLNVSEERTWPVGSLKPNEFGLFDMCGNVWEWCQESYRSYHVGTKVAPSEDVEDTAVVTDLASRVLRGGSVVSPVQSVRSAFRGFALPLDCHRFNGFRVARTYP